MYIFVYPRFIYEIVSFIKPFLLYCLSNAFVFLKKNQYLSQQVFITFTMFERTVFHSVTEKT